MKTALAHSQSGLQLAAAAGLGAWAGHWAGKRWGFEPWGLVLGLLAGAAIGLTVFLLDVLRMSRQEEREKGK